MNECGRRRAIPVSRTSKMEENERNFGILALLIAFLVVPCSSNSGPLQPPRFNAQPSSAASLVSEGRTKILQCSALGIPQPLYRWLRDGEPLGDYSSELFYKIHNTQRADAGAYQCIAKNDVGAIFSEKNHISVAYMGMFDDTAEKLLYVEQGKAAILSLPAIESNPPPSVTWHDEHGPLNYDRKYAFTSNHQLVILSASKEDEKAYRARAINTQLGKEENSPYFTLKVMGEPVNEMEPEIVIKPKDIMVVKGQDNTELQCIANARPLHELETLWFKDGIPIETTGIAHNINDPWNRTLSLIYANLSHTGQYSCQARLKTGGYSTISASANVFVQEKPMFLSNLKSETLGEYGATIKLDCDVQGVPPPGITWYKDSKIIGHTGFMVDDNQIEEVELGGGRYSVEEDRSLVIKGLRSDDVGIFQCIASNDAGEASIYTWLKVKTSVPVMEIPPSNLTVLDGKDATIFCRAAGSPTPNITWYFNDTIIKVGSLHEMSGRIQILDEGDLLIAGLTTTDTGKYKCVRANDAGSVQGEAYLGVTVRTQIVAPPVDTKVLLGNTATLQCNVSSDPNVPYNIDWFHRKQIMVPGSRVWVGSDGSLEISAVRASDAGEYTCSVTSPGGNHTRNAILSVIELPFAPTNVKAIKLEAPSQRAVNISWTPGFDGNSPIRKFIIQKREVPESGPIPDPLLNWITEMSNVSAIERWILLTGLKAATTYQFRVSAVNAVGEGSSSDPTEPINLPHEAPSGPPLSFVGSARSSSEIITQWQPPLEEHRNGHILGYVIRYRLYGYNHSPWTEQKIANAAQRNYLIQDLITWKDYVVQIAAYNDKGVGVFTEGAKIKTKEGVPEAPPVNVKAEALNSTAVSVWWTPPDPQKINGINQGYKLQAWKWDITEEKNTEKRVMSVPPSLLDPLAEQSAVIGGLEKFTSYNISVVCFTDPGDGERSDYVLVSTSQDVPDEVITLQFDDISDRAVKVVWSQPKQSNGILMGYRLKYSMKDNPKSLKEEVFPPNISSIMIENLEATTFYTFEINAFTVIGDGPIKEATIQSGIKPVLPSAPYNLALSNIEAFSVVLQFTPGFDGNSSISRWTVQAQTARNTSWMTIYEISAPDAQSILVKTLVPFTTYRLRLIANNVVGASPPSLPCKEFQTIQAPPLRAPNNVTVRAMSSTDLRVRWIPLQQIEWFGNPRGYNITYKRVKSKKIESILIDDHTSNSFILEKLQAWTQYEISVMACNEVGSSPGSPIAIERTREAVPSMGPFNVTANATSSTTIVVVWGSVPAQHQNGMIEGYKVCYAPLSSPSLPGSLSVRNTQSECKLISSNQTHTTTLTELRKYVTYQIQVLAYTRLGDGSLSKPPITVQTFEDVPGVPSNVSFPDVSFTTARIIWDVPEDPNGEILAYRVTYHLNSSKDLTYAREFLPSDRTFRATTLTSERYYLFTVTAQTRFGWGQTARALVLTTNNRNTPQPPSQPQVSQGQLQPHQITFSWTPGRDGYAPLRYYTVQLRENDGTWITIPERVDPFVTSYTASELKPFTSYEFRIRATNDIGPSRYSKESIQVRTLPAAPSRSVQGLKVIPITRSSVEIYWTPIEEMYWSGDFKTGGYRVAYQPISDFPTVLQTPLKENVMGIKSDKIVLSDLAFDTNYEITVGAFNSQGEGPPGQVAAVWVGEAVPTASPRDVAAIPKSPTEVELTWKPLLQNSQNGDLLGYKVFYLMTDSPQLYDTDKKIEEEIDIVPATDVSHNLVFLDKYTEYRIQILAFNPAGDGPRSSPITVRTHQGLPGAPESLNFTDITMTSMRVSWNVPRKQNGIIVGYIVTYETTQQNEKFSKQVKQKVTDTTLVVGGLEEEVGYTFSVRAMTIDLGPPIWGNISTGPQQGSPVAPRQMALARTPTGVDLHWLNSPSGRGPLLGYYIETRKKDDFRWETITRTSNGPLEDFTISYQSLLPSTGYSFRVISYNMYGISYPAYSDDVIMTPSKLYFEYGYLQHRPFYRQTWFMVALAATSIIIIIMVIAILCVKSKSYKYKQEAQKTLEESMAMDAEERGELALDLYRTRHNGNLGSTGTLRRGQANSGGTLTSNRTKTAPPHPPALSKSPPRPSPASVAYHSDEESLKDYDENPDDSSVTEKPSEMSSSESQNSESENESVRSDPHSFVNHYANVNDSLRQSWKKQKPVRNYSSYTDSEPEGSAVVSLNGGQIIMNNMARSRAPLPGFSSFV